MNQFEQLKKIKAIAIASGADSSYSSYWKIDGDLTENSGGISLLSSGVIPYTNTLSPPVGNTLWFSGSTNQGVRVYHKFEDVFEKCEISMWLRTSRTDIGVQRLLYFQHGLTTLQIAIAESYSGITYTFRDTGGTVYGGLTQTMVPKDQTYKLITKWDNTVPCVTVEAESEFLYSGAYRYVLYSGAHSLRVIDLDKAELDICSDRTPPNSNKFLTNSRFGQVYISGYVAPISNGYITGIDNGYTLRVYNNGIYSDILTGIDYNNNIGMFQLPSPAGKYALVYNGYVAAKEDFPNGINGSGLIIF